MSPVRAQISTSSVADGARFDSKFLMMRPAREITSDGIWLFPKFGIVEVYLTFFRVWLTRELERSLKLGQVQLLPDETIQQLTNREEESTLDRCCRLAFAMFARGITSWEIETLPQVAPTKLNPMQKYGKKAAPSKVALPASKPAQLGHMN